jgi:hypothetical protein
MRETRKPDMRMRVSISEDIAEGFDAEKEVMLARRSSN